MKPATCHPERPHLARGLCNACYHRRRANDPEYAERERVRKREYARQRYANDPEYAERVRERDREWKRGRRANDPEYVEREREYMRQYRARIKAEKAKDTPCKS